MSEQTNNIIRFNYSVDPTTLMSKSWITTNTDTTQNTVTGVGEQTITVTYRDVTYSIEDISHNPIASGVLRVFYTIEKGTLVVTDVTVLSGTAIDSYSYKNDTGYLIIDINKTQYQFSNFSTATENTQYVDTDNVNNYTNTWSYVNGTGTETVYDHYEVELYVNSDVTTFGFGSLNSDEYITSVVFDTYSITSIPDYGVFSYCRNLTSVILPNNLEYIGTYTFYNTNISQITLPSTLEEIGTAALNIANLSITSLATIPPTIYANSISSTATLIIHETSLQAYINSDWADYVTSISTIETPTYDNVLKFNYSEDPTTLLNNLWVQSCTDTSANTVVGVGEHTEEGYMPYSELLELTADFDELQRKDLEDTKVAIQLAGGLERYLAGENWTETQIHTFISIYGNINSEQAFMICKVETSSTAYDDIMSLIEIEITVPDYYEVTLYINSALNTFETTMFTDDNNITSIEFDYDVTSIIDDAFNGCENLSSVTLTSTVPPTIGEDTFSLISPDAVLYVPNASIPTYQNAGYGDYFGEIRGTSPEPPTPFRGYGFNRTNMIDIDYLNEIGIRFNR